MFNIKFKKKSHKMGLKALPIKIQQSRKPTGVYNSQGAVRVENAEAICVEIVTETKKCFKLKLMLNVNVL